MASLRLAVVLIASYAALIAWASFLESTYGTPSIHFAIYGTWWFLALNVMLALNVLFAALVRYPWRQRHLGFVITHLGILILMAGCFLSWWDGIDARVAVVEGRSSGRAVQDSQQLVLEIDAKDDSHANKDENGSQIVQIPFISGPFNWDDYQTKLSWLPWSLARRSRGLLYDRDGVRLEALNYYSNSRQLPIPRISVQVEPALRMSFTDQQPMSVELAVTPPNESIFSERPTGIGDRQKLPGAQRILFWLSGSQAETDAFLNSRPQDPLDPSGEVVLYAHDKDYHFSVKTLREKSRHPLGDTGLEVELKNLNPQVMGMRIPGIELQIHKSNEPPQSMTLYASLPLFNRQDYAHRVFGTFWFPAAQDEDSDEEKGPAGEGLLDAGAP
ncbi:MAG TPA: hypothetical protein VIH42_00630, partial [Thermoguttaceae bacterium]